MTAVNKIDSNATSLAYAEEASLGVLPGTPVWEVLEPNSYTDFGGQITTIARNPINESRQRKKGVVTDQDASGGWQQDLTPANLQDLLQGVFFADLRPKGEEEPTQVTATTDLYDTASTTGFQVNDLIRGTGFTNAANNVSEAIVTAVVSDTTVEVLGETLVTETPPAGAKITVIGHEAGTADIDVDVSGTLPAYTSTVLDFTTLGLLPGEWIFVGGDGASEDFVNAENNGWKRIKSIAANTLTIDKSDSTMVTETGTGLDIRFYFGRVLKNESTSALIQRRSYNLERQLGEPDDSNGLVQSEYIVGAVANTCNFNIPSAEKLTVDLGFVGISSETRDAATGVKTGTRNTLTEESAFNTSSDFSRIKIAAYTGLDEAPTALFAFAQEITLTINNNVSPNKAVGTLGAFEVTAGTFEVGGSLTAYFADVAAVEAVTANTDITIDVVAVTGQSGAKTGVAWDLPLVTLGDGRPNVEQDAPITLPLTNQAATGAGVDSNMDHTLMMVFFDFLPDAADI